MKLKLLILLFVFFLAPFEIYAKEVTIPQIKVLIVPGHDNEVWGAQYGNMKEANMNLVLGTEIYNNLLKDKRFKVYITRDKNGYTKEFANYFSSKKEEIVSFKENAKQETQKSILSGLFIERENVPHISASADMSVKLYGINKWASENKIDAVIHIHFNDYPRMAKWTIGRYQGFSIYMPDNQRDNSKESVQLAQSVFLQLSKKYTPSNYVKELGGLIPDQSLIALGSNNTITKNTRSILVEYGYIYQKIFRNTITRQQAYKTMAGLTTTGIINYFF